MKGTIKICLLSVVVGILLGSGPYAMMRMDGYEFTKPGPSSSEANAATAAPASGGGMCSMMAARLKELEGTGEPRPKRDLAALVRKLDLLTGDIAITLTAAQAAAIKDCLKDVEKPAKMSDDDATAKQDRLLAVLNEKQKASLEAIALPKRAASGGPGKGGPMPGGPGMTSSGPGMGGSMPPGPGMTSSGPAPQADEDQNPFQQDAEGKALKSLRERFASKGTAPKAEASQDPPAKPETPKAPRSNADASKGPATKS